MAKTVEQAAGGPAGLECAHIRCRNLVEARSTGRPARFCSTACRQADHRGRKAAKEAAARLVGADRQLQSTYEQAVRALGGIVDAARFDRGPLGPSPDGARREVRALLDDLERQAAAFLADRKTAAVYGLTVPSQAPANIAVVHLDTLSPRKARAAQLAARDELLSRRSSTSLLGLKPVQAIPPGK